MELKVSLLVVIGSAALVGCVKRTFGDVRSNGKTNDGGRVVGEPRRPGFVPSGSPLFKEDAPAKLTIEGDFSPFMFSQIDDPENWRKPMPQDYVPPKGEVTFLADGNPSQRMTFTATRVFGNLGKSCKYPKLKLVAKSVAPAGNLFSGVKELFMGLPCQTEAKSLAGTTFGRTFEQEKSDIAAENLMYKSLLALGIPGIESRRAEFTFKHRPSKGSQGALVTSTLPGTLLESVSDVAERAGAETVLEWDTSKNAAENQKALSRYPVPTMGKLFYDFATKLWLIGDHKLSAGENDRGGENRLIKVWNTLFVFLKGDRGFFSLIDLDSGVIRGWVDGHRPESNDDVHNGLERAVFANTNVGHVCAFLRIVREAEGSQDWGAFAATNASFDENVRKNFPVFISELKTLLDGKWNALECVRYPSNAADGG